MNATHTNTSAWRAHPTGLPAATITPAQRLALWEDINRYVVACGGDPGSATVSGQRMRAVAAVERTAAHIAAGIDPCWCLREAGDSPCPTHGMVEE